MTFADWDWYNGSGDEAGEWIKDTATKYSGAASTRFYAFYSGSWGYATRKNYSVSQARIIVWLRTSNIAKDTFVGHLSYGDINAAPYMTVNTWEKFRFSFWYDSLSLHKMGRIEKWIDEAWVIQGEDTDFGIGVPANDTIKIKLAGGAAYSWWDLLESYSATL